MVENFVELNRSWLFFSGAGGAHLQGLFSAWFGLSKGDNRESVQSFVTCQPADIQGDATQESGGLYSSSLNEGYYYLLACAWGGF